MFLELDEGGLFYETMPKNSGTTCSDPVYGPYHLNQKFALNNFYLVVLRIPKMYVTSLYDQNLGIF
jgi:hypothetical protein